MAYSKTKKILFILLCLFVILFPFWCVRGLCAEREEVEISRVTNLSLSTSRNYFTSSDNSSVGYIQIDKGYVYYFENNLPSYDITCAFSYDIPEANVSYYDVFKVNRTETYSFISNDYDYIYFDFQHDYNLKVYREKISSMNGAVGDLVDNVGINSIWNIFDISINYIVVVVLVAFGLFIIFKIIRRISKGKEGL